MIRSWVGRDVGIVSFRDAEMRARTSDEGGDGRGGRDGAGHANTADTASNSRKHTAKLALDSWFGTRSWLLRLGALYSLRQRRHSSFATNVLDGQQIALQSVGRMMIVVSFSRRVIRRRRRVDVAVCRSRWRRGFVASAMGPVMRRRRRRRRRRLRRLMLVHLIYTGPVGFIRLRGRRGCGGR